MKGGSNFMSLQVYDLVLNLFIVLILCSCAQGAADNVWWD